MQEAYLWTVFSVLQRQYTVADPWPSLIHADLHVTYSNKRNTFRLQHDAHFEGMNSHTIPRYTIFYTLQSLVKNKNKNKKKKKKERDAPIMPIKLMHQLSFWSYCTKYLSSCCMGSTSSIWLARRSFLLYIDAEGGPAFVQLFSLAWLEIFALSVYLYDQIFQCSS